jgi:hypothetical protein
MFPDFIAGVYAVQFSHHVVPDGVGGKRNQRWCLWRRNKRQTNHIKARPNHRRAGLVQEGMVTTPPLYGTTQRAGPIESSDQDQ